MTVTETSTRTGPIVVPVPTLGRDAETRAFVDAERAREHGRGRWMVRASLRPFLSDFALNGLLGTYPLFLLSEAQWRALLAGRAGGRLLDIGAATGDVTARLAPLFDSVHALDVSASMVRRLRERGFRAERLDLTVDDVSGGPFDTVALLNVLDRCDRPLTLLDRAVRTTRHGGTVIVSIPLPYRPCAYDGPVRRAPRQRLPLPRRSFDEDAEALLLEVLPSFGLEPQIAVRAPYLSGGDRLRPYYELDALVTVAHRP